MPCGIERSDRHAFSRAAQADRRAVRTSAQLVDAKRPCRAVFTDGGSTASHEKPAPGPRPLGPGSGYARLGPETKQTKVTRERTSIDFAFGPCVGDFGLARRIFTLQAWSAQLVFGLLVRFTPLAIMP